MKIQEREKMARARRLLRVYTRSGRVREAGTDSIFIALYLVAIIIAQVLKAIRVVGEIMLCCDVSLAQSQNRFVC
jgi:hypothetical protein